MISRELLYLSGFHVAFLNSEKNHHRYTDIQSRFSRFPGSIRLQTITDVRAPTGGGAGTPCCWWVFDTQWMKFYAGEFGRGCTDVCWPQFGDQLIISRYVSEVWKLGMDMKDTCDRSTVEKLVRDMMEDDDTPKREELMKSTAKMVEMAKKAVSEGGSSYVDFDGSVNRIREMSSHAKK